MAEQTIADEQAKLQQWFEEWLDTDESVWGRSPESLLEYLKTRLCMTTGPA